MGAAVRTGPLSGSRNRTLGTQNAFHSVGDCAGNRQDLLVCESRINRAGWFLRPRMDSPERRGAATVHKGKHTSMKYCYECGRMTPGEPLFCNFCGRSYDVKLCPGRHVNPRHAEVCSQCGSRDLSTPQPKVSWWWKVVALVLRVALAFVVLAFLLALL